MIIETPKSKMVDMAEKKPLNNFVLPFNTKIPENLQQEQQTVIIREDNVCLNKRKISFNFNRVMKSFKAQISP